jgi:hypothetical protein
MPVRIPVPFKAARANEAEAATSPSFKAITRRRVSAPKFQKAARQFLMEFEKARARARFKSGKVP